MYKSLKYLVIAAILAVASISANAHGGFRGGYHGGYGRYVAPFVAGAVIGGVATYGYQRYTGPSYYYYPQQYYPNYQYPTVQPNNIGAQFIYDVNCDCYIRRTP